MVYSEQTEPITDCAFDYFGSKFACSSMDNSIVVYESTKETPELIATLKEHKSPVWRVQWSHPRFGPILASCGYDKQVLLWKETSPKQYNVIYAFTKHTKSVNSICFFPESEGLKLVCGSSDGQVSVLQYNQGNNTWSDEMFVADESGVNAVQVVKYNKQIYIITGGCESILKVFVKQNNAWKCIKEVKQHQDWIRDIAAIVKDDKVLIASCSQDKTTIVYEGGVIRHNYNSTSQPLKT